MEFAVHHHGGERDHPPHSSSIVVVRSAEEHTIMREIVNVGTRYHFKRFYLE